MGFFDVLKSYVPQRPGLPHTVVINKFNYTKTFQARLNLGPIPLDEGLKIVEFFERHLKDQDVIKFQTRKTVSDYDEEVAKLEDDWSPGVPSPQTYFTLGLTSQTSEALEPARTVQRTLWSYSKEFEGKRFSPVKEDEPLYDEFYLSGDLRRKGRSDRMKTGRAAELLILDAVADKLAVEFLYEGKKGESPKPHWVNLRDSDARGFRGTKAHGVRRFSWSKVLSARLMDNSEGKLPEELVLLMDFSVDPETPPLRLTLTKLLSEDRILGLDPVVKSE